MATEPTKKETAIKDLKLVPLKGVLSSADFCLPEQGTWHRQRKKAIMEAHPEVRTLFGTNPMTAAWMAAIFVVHVALSYVFAQTSWYVMVLGAFTFGSWLCFDLGVLGHEAVHRLVFESAVGNRLVAIFAFLPVIGGPFGTLWTAEHLQHHVTVVDKCLRYGSQQNPIIKKVLLISLFTAIVSWVVVLGGALIAVPLILVSIVNLAGLSLKVPEGLLLKPYRRFSYALDGWMAFNIVLSTAYWYLMYQYIGMQGIVYQFLSTCVMNGPHPLGMRQVQEHYFKVAGQPTYSLYSSVAPLVFNVCYHVEHHDFANIPWSRLPALKKMAPEFYDDLVHYDSYTQVLYEFLFTDGMPLSQLFDESILAGDY